MRKAKFVVSINFNAGSGNFFIDFEHPERGNYIVSVKVSEHVARRVAELLGLDIL